MTDELHQTIALERLHADILKRATGFATHPAMFNGKIMAEELRHWAAALREAINDQR